jgi:CTP-dependent riboflavin kinase
MIRGTVSRGSGQARKAFRPERLSELKRLFGLQPYPGTLNVRVPSIEAAIESLGEPAAYTEHRTPIGPLRWWPASLAIPGQCFSVLIVRGQRSKAPYLEIVAATRLRGWLSDGDPVTLTPREPSSSGAQTASGRTSRGSRNSSATNGTGSSSP